MTTFYSNGKKTNVPQHGTYTSGGKTYKNGVLQGTYDDSGNFTPSDNNTSSSSSHSSSGSSSSSSSSNVPRDQQAEEMRLATLQGWGGGTYNDLVNSNYHQQSTNQQNNQSNNFNTPQNTGNFITPDSNFNFELPEGYTYDNGQLMVYGEPATPEENLMMLQQQSEFNALNTEFTQVERDAMNILGDISRMFGETTDYLEQSGDNAVASLESERDTALQELELAKEELNFNLENALSDLSNQQADTQSAYLNASIMSGGARFSTMATGQTNIDEKFAELQQRTYQQASMDLKAIGIKEDATRNYYSAKIADIRLNNQHQISQLMDSMMTKTRDIMLGMSDNKVKMSQMLYDNQLKYTGMIMEYNTKAQKAEFDSVMENINLQLKGQQMATNSGKPFSMVMPNGEVMMWNPKKSGTGGSSIKDNDLLSITNSMKSNPSLYFSIGTDGGIKGLSSAGNNLLKGLSIAEQQAVIDDVFAKFERDSALEAEYQQQESDWLPFNETRPN